MKSSPRSSATCARLAGAAFVAALLGGCYSDLPPEGFDAVPPAGSAGGAGACPDLTGTFDIAGTALARAIAGRQPPQTHGLPVFLTFKPGPTNIEGWWVVPRESLVAFANDRSKDAPQHYAHWRELVLKEHLPENLRQNFDAYLAAVAELGPPGPTYALVVNRGCQDNWMRVQSDTLQTTTKNDEPRSIEQETWLARDAAGALLVRRVTYDLARYSVWAPSTQYLRTSRSSDYQRIPQAAAESAEPLAAADLPPDPRTVERPRMACAEVPARVDAFSQRLNALLPAKAQVARLMLNPVRQQDSNGNCPFAVVDVEIAGGDRYFLGRTVDWLRKEPSVDSVETLRVDAGQHPRLRVVLH